MSEKSNGRGSAGHLADQEQQHLSLPARAYFILGEAPDRS